MTDEDITLGQNILSDKLKETRYKDDKKKKKGEKKTPYEILHEELIDLYLSVKIRKNDEIELYDDTKLEKERAELVEENLSANTLIEYIKSSIEILMALKFDGKDEKEAKTC